MDFQRSGGETPWYKRAVFYEIYVRAFYDSNGDGHGDLRGLSQKLDYLKNLGVDCLWLLPIYPSPLKDDGYDIADYYNILPAYGDLEDFRTLLDEAHARGMRIIIDLVLNHTSDQHPWFQAARADRNSPYRDYYVWSDTDQKYKDARIIFLDSESSNWSWDEQAGQYYWHRFYASQPDLNFDNPAVRAEIKRIMAFWLEMGVDGFRTDAVPYLFEREGTNCENLPETHAFLKELRQFIDEKYPGRVLLAEANQWPEDVRPYFGDGDEFQMGFHFPVMPRIFMSLGSGDAEPLRWIMARTPQIPSSCQWCIFLRNHDELTLEMVTEKERQWMWETFAPEARMRLNLGIRRRLAPLLSNDRQLLELANSLLFTLPGSPIIYYGDEIGMGDNIWLDDRNGVRTPMQWDSSPGAGFSTSPAVPSFAPVIDSGDYAHERVNVAAQLKDPLSLLNRIHAMIRIRKAHPVFGEGSFEWVETDKPSVAAFLRRDAGERILVVHNLVRAMARVKFKLGFSITGEMIDLLTGARLNTKSSGGDLSLDLSPYQYLWLKLPG